MNTRQNIWLAALAFAFALLAGASGAQTPAERMERVVQPYVGAEVFMGSVLVAQSGNALFNKGTAGRTWSETYRIRPRRNSRSPRSPNNSPPRRF